MPVRNFRIYLSNHTDKDLHRTDHHLCSAIGGDSIWTSSDWEPPLIIPARSELAWQSESDGVATGTEGYVKYCIAVDDNNKYPGGPPPPKILTDQIYIYWVNPFIASFEEHPPTEALGVIDKISVNLNCNTDGFNPSPKISEFEIVPETACGGREDWAPGLTMANIDNPILPQIPIAFVMVFGALGIVEHAYARFILRQRGSIGQSLRLGYDKRLGIRSAVPSGTTSLRSVFRL